MNHKRFSTEEELVALSFVISEVAAKTMSLRKGAEHLKALTGKRVSHEGLRKMIRKSLEVVVDNGTDTESLGD